jgi:hypothetical protein
LLWAQFDYLLEPHGDDLRLLRTELWRAEPRREVLIDSCCAAIEIESTNPAVMGLANNSIIGV